MGVVLILTPVVVGSWPIISAAVVAAAAGLGLTVGQEVKETVGDVQQQTGSTYETELDSSNIGLENLGSGKEMILTRDTVTLRVSRDDRGQLKVHASGLGHTKAQLKIVAEEFVQKVNQCFIYNRTVTELKSKKFQMIHEDMASDGTIRIHVRRNED